MQRQRTRLTTLWDEFEWIVVAGAAAAALAFGFVGFGEQPGSLSPVDRLYRSLQLFALEYDSASEPEGWTLQVARLLAPAVAVYAAARALAAVFRVQLQLLRIRSWRGHVVVCGLGRKGWLIGRSFKDEGYRVVAIERDETNPWIAACRDHGIPVVVGDAIDPTRLRKARVGRAAHVIPVCGQDGTNAEIATRAREVARDGREPALTVYAHVVDVELCRLLRERLDARGRGDRFQLELFNVFESGAEAWLHEHPPFREPAAGKGRPHLVVVGVGQMGKNLVLGAARLSRNRPSTLRPRITVVDLAAERKADALRLRDPELDRSCELVPVQIDITWPEFERGEFLLDDDGRWDVTAVYVCLDDDVRGFSAALTLHERTQGRQAPIVVRTAEGAGLASVVQGFEGVHIFPLLERTCTAELLRAQSSR